MSAKKLFENIWNQYVDLNPEALKIHELLGAQGEPVLNDHIAYRTMKHPKLGISEIARIFKKYNYVEKNDYHFEAKKLYAIHLENEVDPTLPKIFISELLLDQFSSNLQETINNVIDQIPENKIKEDNFIMSGRVWDVKHSVYNKLYAESEYAAWFYTYGFCANHFTVNLNALSAFKEVSDLNTFLKSKGFQMNESGGLVKGSPSEFLEQSSTMAYQKNVKFSDGDFKIPSCYYEFAKRYPLDSGELYQGFVAKSADKIFESTNQG